MKNTPNFKFKWSHELKIHRLVVIIYNSIIQFVPFSIKYEFGKKLRQKQIPYSLIKDLSLVVQVGAPRDTLKAGRSRGMYFSLLAGANTKVIIIEPDPENIKSFQTILDKKDIHNVMLIMAAAWNEESCLKLYVSDMHPASNFTNSCKQYDDGLLSQYRTIEASANTIDNLLAEQGISKIDLISVTTNGAEWQIIEGCKQTIAAGLPFICIASGDPASKTLHEKMKELGYFLYSYDDRGCTFKQKDLINP